MNAITKKRNLAEDYHLPYIFSILNKYDLDFIPNIIEWDNEGYTYEYVVGKIIKDDYSFHGKNISQNDILKVKMALDDIWKKLYQISIENLKEGYFLFHDDLSTNNMIWKDDKLILLDIDSFCISSYVPVDYLYNKILGELTEIYRKKMIIDDYEY
jgi:tRNA A-37 threonylcarbamoyl transferase component Bud32